MATVRTVCFVVVLFAASVETGVAQWVLMNNPPGSAYTRVQCFAGAGSNLFAGTLGVGVFLSTNFGSSWTPVNTGLTATTIGALVVSPTIGGSGTNLFAGTASNGVFLSTNNGTGWSAVNTGLTNTNVQALAASTVSGGSTTNLFAGTFGGGVFLSTNNGTSWTAVNNGLPNLYVFALATIPTGGGSGVNVFAAAGTGVFLSTNNGANWTAVSTGLPAGASSIPSLTSVGTSIYAEILTPPNSSLFVSTNNGTSWNPANTGLPTSFERHLAASGTTVFSGNYGTGYYVSTNNGTSWNSVNSGGTNTHSVRALVVFGAYLFGAHYNGEIWRRPLAEMITSVRQETSEIPADFNLAQNYPNPFNPLTTIRFSLPKAANVSLTVFNMLGQIMPVFANELKEPGSYQVQWNASNLPSGVYFYRLHARQIEGGQALDASPNSLQGFEETKKMILLK